MRTYEAWSLLAEGLTLALVAASAWAVWKQLREMAEQTRQLRHTVTMSAEASLDALFVPVTQAYLDHPELRAVFNPREADPPAQLDRETTLRACALAEVLADAMEKVLRHEHAGIGDPPTPLRVWIYDSMYDSAFYREWVLRHRDWYETELIEFAEAAERAQTPST